MKSKQYLHKLLKRRILVLDGAVGTELKKRGMPDGVCPEAWCLDHQKVLGGIHTDYVRAGSDIIYTCTFGANQKKLKQYKVKDVFSVNKRLAQIAKKAAGKNTLVAGDIGPTGEFVEPFGCLKFEEAVTIFKEQIKGLLAGGVDLLVIETMLDIQEARAALIAAKETASIFTMVTMTYEPSGRTLNGNDPLSSLITLQALGASAFGCNCSTGPVAMRRIIASLKPYATIPLVAKPNAGLPQLIGNKTIFNMGPGAFARKSLQLASKGVNMIGGCCGTEPRHIEALKKEIARCKPLTGKRKSISAISSARTTLLLEDNKTCVIVGEKINPTGKKQLQQELLAGRSQLIRELAKEQEAHGADALDVNVGVVGINEPQAMLRTISFLSVTSNLPLVIDSSKPEVIEAALRLYPGRALINSISGERSHLDRLLSCAKDYGAMFILLPLSGKKVPLKLKERQAIIRKICAAADKKGFTNRDIVVDGLALTLSSMPEAATCALKTIAWCRRALKVNTIVGLSNISFGLPQRRLLNQTFLSLARRHGLTLAIADPTYRKPTRNSYAMDVLLNKDKGARRFITHYSQRALREKKPSRKAKIGILERIGEAVREGNREGIEGLIKEALKEGTGAFFLMQKVLIPAIIKVGEAFEAKRSFLPQLIASAEAMKRACNYLEPYLEEKEIKRGKKGIVLLATVRGDIHDIGKNIVALLLGNHGFQIIDIGKDISCAKILQAIKKHKPDIVGLSALMTTTMVNMKEVIKATQRAGFRCKFMVGGAVVTKRYAASIGAQYAKDGVQAVHVAEELLGGS